MKTQHTPGPWKTNGDPVVFSNDSSQFIAFTDTRGISSDAAKANARLIAAAPDLLEALKHAVEIAEYKTPGYWYDLLKYRAIIAKATGAA